MEKVTFNKYYTRAPRTSSGGFSIVEVLIAIAALAIGLAAAYAAQFSSISLSNFARETDMASFASNSAVEMVTARPFIEMIDPDPVSGSVDTDELAALQPPYDPRGFATYLAQYSTYPDAPTTDYVSSNNNLFSKVLLYGARIWEPVQKMTTRVDPATNISYKLYPMGTLQQPKVLTWFEPRPIQLNGGAGTYYSSILKNNALGFPALVPTLSDNSDLSSGQPTTIVTAVGWFPVKVTHDSTSSSAFNPLALFIPPSDGSNTFTASEISELQTMRDNLKKMGLRVQYNRTVMKP